MALVVGLLAALAACGSAATPRAASGTAGAPWLEARTHLCRGGFGFAASIRRDSAWLSLPDRPLARLGRDPRIPGGYSDGVLAFRRAGEAWTLETPTGIHRGCRVQPAEGVWERARLAGVAYRAVGQEPGWLLEIVPGRWMHFSPDYGLSHVYTPVPPPLPHPGSDRVTYQASTPAHELRVELRSGFCQDTMSGELFPLSVTVRLDDQDFVGCGMALAATTQEVPT